MANSAQRGTSDFNTKIMHEFRANQGRVGGFLAGTPMILIHHIGARSGIECVTPLAFNPSQTAASRPSRAAAQAGHAVSCPRRTPGQDHAAIPVFMLTRQD
jgi:hypothetical protein